MGPFLYKALLYLTPVMCGLRTCLQTDVVLQRFLDPWNDIGSVLPEKLQMWTDPDPIPCLIYYL